MADVAKVVTVIGSSPESFAKAADARGSGSIEDDQGHQRSRRDLDERTRRGRQDHDVPDDGEHRVRNRAQLEGKRGTGRGDQRPARAMTAVTSPVSRP